MKNYKNFKLILDACNNFSYFRVINMANKYKYFIITGDPGIGKTTLIKKISSTIVAHNIKVNGFYTEEIRRNGTREGFDVVTLDGVRGRLARDQSLLNNPIKCKVGKYGVLTEEFENVALPCLYEKQQDSQSLLVVDEIGKMELFSNAFKNKIRSIFSPQCNCAVLATIPVRKSDTLIENIRNHNKAKIWLITHENRNFIYEDIMTEIEASLTLRLK